MDKKPASTIKTYITKSPKEVQSALKEIYGVIKKAAPKATESIKYGMPTFELNGNLVHFAAMKGHLGFYPAPSGITNFKKELKGYSTSKGCIRFKYDEPLPHALIKKIVILRVKENLKK